MPGPRISSGTCVPAGCGPGVPLGPEYRLHRPGGRGDREGCSPRGHVGFGVGSVAGDDTLVLVWGTAWGRTAHLTELSVACVVAEIKGLGLKVSPEKSVAMWFCRRADHETPPAAYKYMRAVETERQQWLQEIPLQNSFSALPQEMESDPAEKPKTHIAKPPPIHIDAQIIDPLIELLNITAGKENYSTKQLKLDQVKVQTNTPETYRKVVKVLKEKNAGYHTYQLKTDESYKAVIRGLHPKTNTSNICEELAKIGHQTREINNITRYNTKQPLPLFLIELEPKNNNKEIFEIKKVLNTIITVEPPRHKKDISNVCGVNNMDIQKITATETRANHPASYKGCTVRKQLQRKLSPPLRNRTYNNYHTQQDSAEIETSTNVQHVVNINHNNTNTIGSRSYAQVTKQSTPLDNQNQNNNINDATEIKELLKQSIKNTEMLTKMISEQNAILRQQTQQIAVMLQLLTNMLKTHFTIKHYLKIPYYTIYDTKHPSGKAHGGTAVIIRNDIKNHFHSQVCNEYIQATTVTVQTSSNYLQLSAVYVPPRHKITSQMREEYFQHLGDKYIAAGDYNSKHTLRGSRITTPRDNTWARSNEEQAEEFSSHLSNIFTPHNINNSNHNCHTDEDALTTSTSTDKHYIIPKTTAQKTPPKYPTEQHAHTAIKESEIPRTPRRNTTHMETAY
uniref:putative uncharacterized protein DDB_G0289041 n=1 Tax=Bombus vancouverensis nearcticus TaxID=2705178 RepID=UPI001439A3D2|nr:putative uncharacterized protein DDB_G0289041 [Bombus vancouverensis nearcticus]